MNNVEYFSVEKETPNMSTTFTDPTDDTTLEVKKLDEWTTADHDGAVHFSVTMNDGDEDFAAYLPNSDRAPLALAVLGEPLPNPSRYSWLADVRTLVNSPGHTEETLAELSRRCLLALLERRGAAEKQAAKEAERAAVVKAIEDAIGPRPLNLAQPLAPQLAERGIVAA